MAVALWSGLGAWWRVGWDQQGRTFPCPLGLPATSPSLHASSLP